MSHRILTDRANMAIGILKKAVSTSSDGPPLFSPGIIDAMSYVIDIIQNDYLCEGCGCDPEECLCDRD